MRTNLLVRQPPRAVEVCGQEVEIRTGYRRGIQCARIIDEGFEGRQLVLAINRLYFPEPPSCVIEAFDAAIAFYSEGISQGLPSSGGRKGRSTARLLDWDEDASMILGDFRREYGIDLSSPDTQMHWFVFMAYFNALSDSSGIKTAMTYRATSTYPQAKKGDDVGRKNWNAMKKRYTLPPRNRREASAREGEVWGD